MPTFKYKNLRRMTPRDGVRYATEYYKQTPAEYTKLCEHVEWAMGDILLALDSIGQAAVLEQPLRKFPRTNSRPNYSAFDVMNDMREQLAMQRDVPSGILGRWQRLFESNPEYQIELVEDLPANPIFNQLYYQ